MAGSNASETLTSAATLQGLLAHEAELIQQASEALPHSFEKCTYSMGPIRQMVYWCRTCAEPRGICSACSIACHGDHEQVELFAKRDFQCDCPTSCLSHQCTLHKILAAPNDANTYGQNYIGNFCRCGRPYDAATEEETMVQCVACEDWFHESCLHLRARATSGSRTEIQDVQDEDIGEEDEENDPNLILKPSEYESLVCGTCVRKSPLLSRWAGTPGARMLVWRTSASESHSAMGDAHSSTRMGLWTILGKGIPCSEDVVDIESSENQSPQKQPSLTASFAPPTQTSASLPHEPSTIQGSVAHVTGTSGIPEETVDRVQSHAVPLKRPLSPSALASARVSPARGSPAPKRARGDGRDGPSILPRNPSQPSHPISRSPSCAAPSPAGDPGAQYAIASSSRGPFVPSEDGENAGLRDGDSDGDLFLSEGWRERWCRCPDCITGLWREPHLMEETEVYEPPEDPDANFSLEELGMRALEKLPRDKALDGIRAYNAMRDELLLYLRPFADGDKVVSEEDVKAFFESRMAELQNRSLHGR